MPFDPNKPSRDLDPLPPEKVRELFPDAPTFAEEAADLSKLLFEESPIGVIKRTATGIYDYFKGTPPEEPPVEQPEQTLPPINPLKRRTFAAQVRRAGDEIKEGVGLAPAGRALSRFVIRPIEALTEDIAEFTGNTWDRAKEVRINDQSEIENTGKVRAMQVIDPFGVTRGLWEQTKGMATGADDDPRTALFRNMAAVFDAPANVFDKRMEIPLTPFEEDTKDIDGVVANVGKALNKTAIDLIVKIPLTRALGKVGVPHSASAFGVFGMTPEGFDYNQGVLMAAVPTFMGLGERVGGKIAGALAQRGGALATDGMQQLIKSGTQAATLEAYFQTLNAPEYVDYLRHYQAAKNSGDETAMKKALENIAVMWTSTAVQSILFTAPQLAGGAGAAIRDVVQEKAIDKYLRDSGREAALLLALPDRARDNVLKSASLVERGGFNETRNIPALETRTDGGAVTRLSRVTRRPTERTQDATQARQEQRRYILEREGNVTRLREEGDNREQPTDIGEARPEDGGGNRPQEGRPQPEEGAEARQQELGIQFADNPWADAKVEQQLEIPTSPAQRRAAAKAGEQVELDFGVEQLPLNFADIGRKPAEGAPKEPPPPKPAEPGPEVAGKPVTQMADRELVEKRAQTPDEAPGADALTQEINRRFPDATVPPDPAVTFDQIGPGHAKFAKALNLLQRAGTLTKPHVEVLKEIFRNTRDEALLSIELIQSARLNKTGEARPAIRQIALKRGLAKAARGEGVTDAEKAFWASPENHPVVVMLHEFGHHAYWRFLSQGERRVVEDAYRRLQEEYNGDLARFFAEEGIASPDPAARRNTSTHFSKSVDEFLAQSFAEWVISRKVSDNGLRRVFQKMYAKLKEAIARIFKRNETHKLGSLEPVFEAMLRGGDKPLADMMRDLSGKPQALTDAEKADIQRELDEQLGQPAGIAGLETPPQTPAKAPTTRQEVAEPSAPVETTLPQPTPKPAAEAVVVPKEAVRFKAPAESQGKEKTPPKPKPRTKDTIDEKLDRSLRADEEPISEDGWVYHATNKENARDIAETGRVNVYPPHFGTDQRTWPDGSSRKRSYWSKNASIVADFAPEEGQSVIIRTRHADAFKPEKGTGDYYTEGEIPATVVEILTEKGWEPIADRETPVLKKVTEVTPPETADVTPLPEPTTKPQRVVTGQDIVAQEFLPGPNVGKIGRIMADQERELADRGNDAFAELVMGEERIATLLNELGDTSYRGARTIGQIMRAADHDRGGFIDFREWLSKRQREAGVDDVSDVQKLQITERILDRLVKSGRLSRFTDPETGKDSFGATPEEARRIADQANGYAKQMGLSGASIPEVLSGARPKRPLEERINDAIKRRKLTNIDLDGWKQIHKDLTPEERDRVRTNMAEDMTRLWSELPADSELLAAAAAGKVKRGWYRRAEAVFRRMFGPDTEKFVGVVAATSPQTPVAENLFNALKIWTRWVDAGRPDDSATIKDIIAETAKNDKGTQITGAHINNIVRALRDETLSGEKVESFRKNLLGDTTATTNDTWIALFMDFQDPTKIFNLGPYLTVSAKMRRVARQLGWQPVEVQEALWSFYKTLFEITPEARPRMEALKDLTVGDIARTPEFYELIFDNQKVRDAVESAGFNVGDLERTFRNREAVSDTTPVLGGEGPSGSRILRRAAARADFQREQRERLARENEAFAEQDVPIPEVLSGVAPTPEEAMRLLETAELRGGAALPTEARAISGQVSFLHRKLYEHLPAVTTGLPMSNTTVERVLERAGLEKIRATADLVKAIVPPEEFQQGMARLAGRPEAETYAKEVAMRWLVAKRDLQKVQGEHAAFLERMQKPGFLKKLDRTRMAALNHFNLELVKKYYEADVSTAIANAADLLARKAYKAGEYDQLQREVRTQEARKSFTNAVTSAITDMVKVFTKAGESTINALYNLPSTPDSVKFIVDEYHRLKPYGGPDQIVVQWAAETLSRLKAQRQSLLATSLLNEVADLRKEYTAYENAIAKGLEKNPVATVKRLVTQAGRFGTNAERARTLFRRLNADLIKEVEEFETLQAADDLARRILEDPEVKAYERDVNREGKIEARPKELTGEEIDDPMVWAKSGIPLPDGTRTKPIVLYGDEKRFAETWDELNTAIDRISEHITNFPDDVFNQQYWPKVLNYLNSVLATSMVMAPTSLEKPLTGSWPNSPLGMLKVYADSLGTRAAGPLKISLGIHSVAERAAKVLQAENHYKHVNIMSAGAESHPEFGKIPLNDRIRRWYDNVFNPLLSSWQNAEGGLVEGDMIRGHKITKEDMAALKFTSELTSKGFDIVQKTVPSLRTTANTVFKTEIGETGVPVNVQSTKVSQNTVTRSFNSKSIELVKAYTRATTPEQKLSVLNDHFWKMVVSHISDRANVFFDGKSKYEDAYRVIRDEINNNGLSPADRHMGWLVQKIHDITGILPDQIQQDLVAEFDTMMGRLGRLVDKESGGIVNVETLDQKTPFTEARKAKVAGDWFYNHGFKDTPALMNFIVGIQAFHYEQAVKQLTGIREDLQRQKEELDTKARQIADRTGVTEASAKKQLAKQVKAERQIGTNYDRYIDIDRQLKLTDTFIHNFSDIFSKGGRDADFDYGGLQRSVGSTTGSVLMSELTALRNLTSGALYVGQGINKMRGTILTGYIKSGVDFYLNQLPKMVASFGLSAAKGAAKSLAKGPALSLESIRSGQTRAAFVRFFQPFLEEITQNYSERVRISKELQDRGYESKHYVVEDVIAKLKLPSTGGNISEIEPTSWAGHMGHRFLALWDAGLSAFGKPLFPKFADKIVNVAGTKTAFDLIRDYENQLRSVWLHYKDRGIDRWDFNDIRNPKNYLTPEEALGKLPYGKRTETDFTNLKQVFEWAGIPYQEAALNFLKKLDAGARDSTLLNEGQRFEIADVLVQDYNRASSVNRPLQFRKKGAWQIISPLLGWNAQRYSQMVRLFSRAGTDKNFGPVALWVSLAAGFILPSLIAGALSDTTGELMARAMLRTTKGEVRPTRLPWEREGGRSQAIGWLISAANPIPFVQTIVNTALNDLPGRASADPMLFIQSKVKDVIKYAGGVASTGDMTFGLPQLLKGFLPLSSSVINRLPSTEGSLEALNARRLLTRFGPQDMLQRKGIEMSAGSYTPLTPYGEKLLNAAMRDDPEEFDRLYEEAINVAESIGKEDPEKSVQQMFTSRNPYSRAFTTKITDAQRSAIYSKLSGDDAAALRDVERKFQKYAARTGVQPPTFVQETPGQRAIAKFKGGRSLSIIRGLRSASGRTRIGRTIKPLRSRVRRPTISRARSPKL